MEKIIEKAEKEIFERTGLVYKLIPLCYDKKPAFDSYKLKQAVSIVTGISVNMMLGVNRERDVINARRIYAYLAQTKYDQNLMQIQRQLNKKQHGTIIHLISTAKDYINIEKEFKNQVINVLKVLEDE